RGERSPAQPSRPGEENEVATLQRVKTARASARRSKLRRDETMEFVTISGTDLKVSRLRLGTWAMGGWMWGGTDEREAVRTIHAALDKGINLIDTAPVYGFGRSEEIVGRAIAESGQRQQVIIATKVGLEWRDGGVFRNSARKRIFQEVEDSLRRL